MQTYHTIGIKHLCTLFVLYTVPIRLEIQLSSVQVLVSSVNHLLGMFHACVAYDVADILWSEMMMFHTYNCVAYDVADFFFWSEMIAT